MIRKRFYKLLKLKLHLKVAAFKMRRALALFVIIICSLITVEGHLKCN